MFTGIVQAVGNIIAIQPFELSSNAPSSAALNGVRLSIDAGGLDMRDVQLGDSIAINGACMTVTSLHNATFTVDVSHESLSKTAGLDALGEVNLEKALRLADRLGGHLVSGHVDGVGRVQRFEAVGESWLLEIAAAPELARYMAYKGSVVINGVSLTVNQVNDIAADAIEKINAKLNTHNEARCVMSINLIPHTLTHTTLKNLRVNSQVNLEIDLIARYVERMLSMAQGGFINQ